MAEQIEAKAGHIEAEIEQISRREVDQPRRTDHFRPRRADWTKTEQIGAEEE